jgi:hypothetical protein
MTNSKEGDEKLKKRGLYYADDLLGGLDQFHNRLSHEIIVFDGAKMKEKEKVEALNKNIIKLSNRIIIINDEETEGTQRESLKPFKDLIDKRKVVSLSKSEIENCDTPYDLYLKLRALWVKKFFKIKNNEEVKLYLCGLDDTLRNGWKLPNSGGRPDFNFINVSFDSPQSCTGIIIDHHGKYASNNVDKLRDLIAKKIPDAYYEFWDKGSYLTFIMNSPPQENDERLEKLIDLVEMGLLRIIVIDERILEKCVEKRKKILADLEPYLWELLKLQKVFVISHINNCQVSENVKKKTNVLVFDTNNGTSLNDCPINGNIDFIIIHKTILTNKEFTDSLGLKNNDISEWINNLESHIPFVILDSGRGEVDIPDKAKFLPYSFLEEVLVENVSKYKLTKCLLKLARAINREAN